MTAGEFAVARLRSKLAEKRAEYEDFQRHPPAKFEALSEVTRRVWGPPS